MKELKFSRTSCSERKVAHNGVIIALPEEPAKRASQRTIQCGPHRSRRKTGCSKGYRVSWHVLLGPSLGGLLNTRG
jgi:hypothetical protein